MIENKVDYEFYREQDRIMLGYKRKKPRLFTDEIWKFQILLRKLEYYSNCKNYMRLTKAFINFKYHKISIKLGLSIPINVFGPGLSIAHWGGIIVNGKAKVGSNCRIQSGVVIGASYNSNNYPVIGNNCYIGAGAKIIGNVTLGDNVSIGANAVVVKDCENNVTLVGVPARVVNRNGSDAYFAALKQNFMNINCNFKLNT